MPAHTLAVVVTCLFASVFGRMAAAATTADTELAGQKREAAELIDKPNRCWLGRPSAYDLQREKWLRDHSAAVLAVAEERIDAVLRGERLPAPDSVILTIAAAIVADRDAAAALIERCFRDVRLALTVAEPAYHQNAPVLKAALGAEKWEHVNRLVGLRECLLNAYLHHIKRPNFIDEAKALTESDRYTSLTAALYLLGQMPDHPELRAFLESKRDDPNSRLYRAPLFKRLKSAAAKGKGNAIGS